MDPLRSFSDYDLLAHVPQGFLAFAATDYVFKTQIILDRTDWNAGYFILVLVGSYVVGHLLAGPSQFLLEKGLARTVLGTSSSNLLAHTPSKSLWRFVFPEYFCQAGYPTRTAVLAKTGIADPSPERSENAFWVAYRGVREDEYTRSRLKTFLNLYGFCRNITFLALISAVAVLISSARSMTTEQFWTFANIVPIATLFAVAFLMCQRYLKFYRLYALEIFVSFGSSHSLTPPPAPKGTRKA